MRSERKKFEERWNRKVDQLAEMLAILRHTREPFFGVNSLFARPIDRWLKNREKTLK